MLGFGKKSKPEDAPKPAPGDTDLAKAEPSLRLREQGGFLAPKETPPQHPKPEEPKTPFRTPKKTKLHLMTGHEERERSFQAAREHFLVKNLPTIQKEVIKQERSDKMAFFMDRLVAVVGFFLIALIGMWTYNHADEIVKWWLALIESIKVI